LKANTKSSSILKTLEFLILLLVPLFLWKNLLGPGLEQGQSALPLSSSTTLQQSALENIAEFSALVLERREPFLGKRIVIASDEVTGKQAAEILSNELGQRIRYVPIPLEQVYQANEDMARMYNWYEKAATGIDITSLHQEYPEVKWLSIKDWSISKLR
jgi:DNA helicase TIP49 (TBP-interacting protein)